MQATLAKLVHDLRERHNSRSRCKEMTGAFLNERFGIKQYRGMKRDFNSEVDRQFDRVEARQLITGDDPLLAAKRTRLGRVKQKYLLHAEFSGNYQDRDKGDMRFVSDYDGKRRMAVIRVDSWVQYSCRYGTYRRCAGLVLFDEDAQEYRFLRVGPDIETIDGALEYIKPAAVRKAQKAGKRVVRQGDMYFVPARKWNLTALRGTNHFTVERQDGGWDIEHETHPTVSLTSPHRAYSQLIVRNGGFGHGGGRSAGHAD